MRDCRFLFLANQLEGLLFSPKRCPYGLNRSAEVGVVLGRFTKNYFHVGLLVGVAFGGLIASSAARADTLAQALVGAYRSNSTLNAERARQRGTDEQVPQALSGWRPTITAQGTAARQWADTNVTDLTIADPVNLSISLSQPLFRGFKTLEATKVAEANVQAGRQQLLGVEQTTLFNAVQAYMNVVQNRQVLSLRRKFVGVLQKQLYASDARFKAGELTRTDVAQSRASLKGAEATMAVAVANVKAAEANYQTVIGKHPGKLAAPSLAKRPNSLDAALNIAQETNPNILLSAYVVEAAEHQIEVIKGDLLPTLSLNGSYTYSHEPSSNVETAQNAQIQGVLTVPLYEGGRTYSAVRQAKQTASQNRIQVISATRSVRENVTNAWNNLIATGQSLSGVGAQVSASRLALDGVRQEYAVGSRTTIDVLNAEQALLNAQISSVVAQHDQVVASYQLLTAMGRMTAQRLQLGELYDPSVHYDDVRGKWIGLRAETLE